VSAAFVTKGTGAIDLAAGSSGVNISNGGTVTSITRTAAGSAYTTNPTPSIAVPTTAGGTQATATCTIGVVTAAVSAGGSGYVVGEILTVSGGTSTAAAVLTVATVSGTAVATVNITTIGTYTASPTNPAATTSNLSGTGATFTLSFGVNSAFTITAAGSGYVEQPTVTFSGGGGSGAAAYATVGSGTIIKSLGATGQQSLDFYTPASASNGVPALRIRDLTADSYFQLSPGSGGVSFLALGNAGANLNIASNGLGSINLQSNASSGITQLRVSATASAVNYVQVTGAATGANPKISTQGSDSTIGFDFQTKGAKAYNFFTNTNNLQLEIAHVASVNWLQVKGSTAGTAPVLSSQGTDTDIDLTLTPKNAGNVRFGTYTASALLAVAGYITIKDSGGTTRRLLVG
jgi:hypothetical protein